MSRFEHKEINLSSQLLVSNQMSEELKIKLEDLKGIHQRDVTDLKRQYESQLDNLKLSNERVLLAVSNFYLIIRQSSC